MNWGHFLCRQDFQVDVLSHSSDDLLNTCRICRDETVRESLVSPCYCSGTLAKCHVPCLEEWLSKANKSTCEICGYKYLTTRIPKSFNEVSPNERKQSASVRDILDQFTDNTTSYEYDKARSSLRYGSSNIKAPASSKVGDCYLIWINHYPLGHGTTKTPKRGSVAWHPERRLRRRLYQNLLSNPIQLIPKWRPINYYFVCMFISPLCFIFTSK